MNHESVIQLGSQSVPRIGLGCWPIGGKQMGGNISFGYSGADDVETLRALRLADEMGAKVFDTAAAYGFGHSEKLLGAAFGGRDDVVIVTKFGYPGDYATRQGLPPDVTEGGIRAAIDLSRKNLNRDRLDFVLLHIGDLPEEEARPVFSVLQELRQSGVVGDFGWSTDDVERLRSFSSIDGFALAEVAMNIFEPNARMVQTLSGLNLPALVRSPLAMGLLGGNYGEGAPVPEGDIRRENLPWVPYFTDGKASPVFLEALLAVRELLMSNGRSLAQGALGWVLAQDAQLIPIPGFRTQKHVEDNLQALAKGPLPATTIQEINQIIGGQVPLGR